MKEKFLKDLERKLSILNEKERKDIIDEYKSTIEEKIKHGKTEEEAIKDFGNVDELAKEILKAYKIDPKYKENDFNRFINDGEKAIKDCADNLAKGTKDMIDNFKNNNKEANLSLIFEIIIKVFLTLLVLGILRIPFMIFTNIGKSIFDSLFSPINSIVGAIFSLLLTILYLVIVVLVISKVFKEYFVKEEANISSNPKETKTSKPEKKIKKQDSGATSAILTIAKILVVFFVLLPLIGLSICTIALTTVSYYYWIKGIDLFGLSLLLTGASIITVWFTYLIGRILNNKRVKVYMLVVGIIMVVIGIIFFGKMISNIEVINEAPYVNNSEVITNTYEIDKQVYINHYDINNVKKTVDNNIEDGKFKMVIKYDKEYYNISINEDKNYTFDNEQCEKYELCGTYDYIKILYDNSDTKQIKKLYNAFTTYLKDNKIYNYTKIFNPEIEISASEKTLQTIKID